MGEILLLVILEKTDLCLDVWIVRRLQALDNRILLKENLFMI